MEQLTVAGQQVPLKITLRDLIESRDKGLDVGDLDVLRGVALNSLTAVDIAVGLYKERCDKNALLDAIEPVMADFVDAFRNRLVVFFPVLGVMLEAVANDLKGLTPEDEDSTESGEPSENAGQSSDSE